MSILSLVTALSVSIALGTSAILSSTMAAPPPPPKQHQSTVLEEYKKPPSFFLSYKPMRPPSHVLKVNLIPTP